MKKVKKDFELAATNSKPTNEEINSSTIDNNIVSQTEKRKTTKQQLSDKQKRVIREITKAIDLNKIETKPIEYIWYPYLPKRKVVMVYGDPATLKTTQILDIASRITNGGTMPFTNEKVEQENVVYVSHENDIDDTVKPNLIKLNMNFNYFNLIEEKGKYKNEKGCTSSKKIDLSQIDRIKWILKRYKPTLFIIDPIQSYLPRNTNVNSITDMRIIFDSIIELASEYNCTFVFIAHTNKGDGKGMDKVMGSRDMTGAPRVVLRYGENPLNKEEILVEIVKNSCAKKECNFTFKAISENRNFKGLEYLDLCKTSFDDFRENNFTKKERPIDFVKTWLKAELAYGGVDSNIVKEKASKLDIAPATLNRAKEDLNIQSIPKGKQRDWVLPTGKEDNDDWGY